MLLTPHLYVPRFMVWNEEEAQKSHLFDDLKPTNIALTLEAKSVKIGCRNQEPVAKTSRRTSQQSTPTGAARVALEGPRKRDKNCVSAAFWWGYMSSFDSVDTLKKIRFLLV